MVEKVLTFLGRSEIWIAGSALAVFLVLTWILRGAPPGQAAVAEEDADAPRAGHRDRIVVGVVVGLLLILGGASVALDRGVPWSLPMLGLGFGLVLTLVRLNRRYRHASPSLRRTLDFSDAFLNLALLAGVLIVINVLAFRYAAFPLDMTREGTYSLASQTLNQLNGLDRPVTFTVISGHGPLALRQRERVDQLLESYRAANPRWVQVASLDPYLDLDRIENLSKRVPDLAQLRGGGVLIEYGEGPEAPALVVRNQEMFEPIPAERFRSTSDRFESAFYGEDVITSALMRLRGGKRAKVAFTSGHGEPRPDDPSGKGLSNWKARLMASGCEVIELNLGQQEIPADLALLIIAGPTDPFPPNEVARIREYADRDGPVLLLLGNSEGRSLSLASPGKASRSGLDEFLKSFNLEIGRGLVIDLRLNYQGNVLFVKIPTRQAAPHPISSAMDPNHNVIVKNAAPIVVRGLTGREGAASEPVNRNLVPTVILQTSPYSWAETDLKNPRPILDPSTDTKGPVPVGVAVARRAGPPQPGVEAEEKPRLVLFSSAEMADNVLQEIAPSNLDLIMNAASWLRGRPDTMGISAKTHVALTLAVDDQLRSRLIMVPSATALMLIIAVGIIVYVARRE
jgi:gliding motility-associatede transport system auxiliary component